MLPPPPTGVTWDEEKQWASTYLHRGWPKLSQAGFTINDVTSRWTIKYNCIAFAAKDETQPWWPVPPGASPRYYYWPPGLPLEENVRSFLAAFATLGFEQCQTSGHEFGYEKVALYVDAYDSPKHMARELGDGIWYSKLGDYQDIRHHALDGVENAVYGQAKYFMRKRVAGISKWAILKNRLKRIFTRQ